MKVSIDGVTHPIKSLQTDDRSVRMLQDYALTQIHIESFADIAEHPLGAGLMGSDAGAA